MMCQIVNEGENYTKEDSDNLEKIIGDDNSSHIKTKTMMSICL